MSAIERSVKRAVGTAFCSPYGRSQHAAVCATQCAADDCTFFKTVHSANCETVQSTLSNAVHAAIVIPKCATDQSAQWDSFESTNRSPVESAKRTPHLTAFQSAIRGTLSAPKCSTVCKTYLPAICTAHINTKYSTDLFTI